MANASASTDYHNYDDVAVIVVADGDVVAIGELFDRSL